MIRTLLICVVLFSTYTAKAEPLRILTYNVLLGFNHGKAPEVGAKWIAEQKPDIVALQEFNEFKQGTLEKIAKKWNHDHVKFRGIRVTPNILARPHDDLAGARRTGLRIQRRL